MQLQRRALSFSLPLLASATLFAAASDASHLYPTDRCVATKLRAAGRACTQILRGSGADPAQLAQAIHDTQAGLATRWRRAEARSLRDGVECAETTPDPFAIADLVEAGAADIEALATAGLDLGDPDEARCGRQWLRDAGALCVERLSGEAKHLRARRSDRMRVGLRRSEAAASRRFARRMQATADGVCQGIEAPEGIEDAVVALVDEVKLAATVSPSVSTEFTKIEPPAKQSYLGRTLEPICSKGTEWFFFARRGSVNKLLVYYQGGGACWEGATCGVETHKASVSEGDNPANSSSGFADNSNPDNPFRDWHVVFVPYCTGDVHWGDEMQDYPNPLGGDPVRIHHRGFINAQVAEKWAREHFVDPEMVFVTGSSAGAYGAATNSAPLQEFVYPSTEFVVLGDAGNGVITQDFLENNLANWGIEKNLPDWIPELNVPLGELDMADLWVSLAKTYPKNRFGTYTTSFDGSIGGQTGFFNIMMNPGDTNQWGSWWEASCQWNEQMRALNLDTSARASNFRFYVGSGSRHTMWGSDRVYTDTTGNVPTIAEWIEAMLDDTPEWVDVETTDPGLLLPGDPAPAKPTPPFEADRIVCE